jgi:hypothetical protein
MYQQLWGYTVEEKLYLGVREQKRLNTTAVDHQILIPNILASFPTSSLQRAFGLPVFRCPIRFTYINLLGTSSSSILLQIHHYLEDEDRDRP